MKKEELLALLRQYMGTAGDMGDKLITEVIRQLNSGKPLAAAIDTAIKETNFNAAYIGNLVDSICTAALLGYGIKVPTMQMKAAIRKSVLADAWAPDKMKLSKRLHGASRQMRTAIIDTISAAMRKGKTVKALSMNLYDGYNSGKKVLRGAELPQYLQRMVAAARTAASGDRDITREFNLAVKAAQKQLEKMNQPDKALKVAYQQLVDAAQNLNQKALEKAVWVGVQEKARYYADRIAITEMSRAWSDWFYAKTYDDPLVIGYGWRLSSSHPVVDICDFHAQVDLYGMGAGNYPKDKVPPHPAHPFCRCNLIVLYKGDVTPGAFNPDAGAAWLNAQSQLVRQKLLGIEGNRQFEKDGKWQKALRHWKGHVNPKLQLKNNLFKALPDDKLPSDVEKWYNKIVKAEPAITNTIQSVVQDAGGQLEGLEFRVKTKESYLRKVEADYQAAQLESLDISQLSVAAKINDAIRYTAVAGEDSLTVVYSRVIDQLLEKQYEVVKMKNTWLETFNPYKGINVIIRNPQGQNFELQFHTPASFDLKQRKMHELYEEFRLLTTSAARREELRNEMLKLSRELPKPKDVEKIF
jgi:hypothetical protein